MNTIRLIPFFLLLVIVSLTSCKKDDDSNVKINIDEEFDVQLFEDLRPNKNQLLVYVTTKENLACSNVELGHSVNATEPWNIVVSIDSLELNGDCDNIEAAAQTSAELGEIPTGSYDLEINLALSSITNKGKLIVTQQGYSLDMETSHGLTIIEEELMVIPDNYFWGYIDILDNAAAGLRNQFLTALETYAITAELNEGHYGHFNFKNGKAELNDVPFHDDVRNEAATFIFELNSDREALKNFILDFQTNHGGEAKVVMFMGDGEVF